MKKCHWKAKERGKEYECDRLNLYCETPTERRLNITFFFGTWRSQLYLFDHELPDSSKRRRILYLQISHVTKQSQHLSKDTNNKLFTYCYRLITLLVAPKQRCIGVRLKCGSLSTKSEQTLYLLIFKKHTFPHENFKVGLHTLFTRKSMSNKKWDFSRMVVRPFSKSEFQYLVSFFFSCHPTDSGY
jgi:hypothetical protein